MNERLDLENKKTWLNPSNSGQIAEHFGYEYNDNFLNALSSFNEKLVRDANVTLYLAIFALRFFAEWEPPLRRVNKKNESVK